MYCKLCNENINEKGQDNISPISDYPVCEDCKDDIMCAECYEGNYGGNLYYVAKFDKILCRNCLLEEAEEQEYLHTTKTYHTNEWHRLCADYEDLDPVFEYLQDYCDLGIQEIKEC